MVCLNAINVVLLSFTLPRQTWAVFSSDGCGSTKSCQRLPDDCSPSSADCVFFSWNWNGATFDMELSGGLGNGNTYAAAAFGQVNGMQDADLYYCTGDALVSSGVITGQQPPNILTIDLASDLTVSQMTTSDGVAQCAFSRAPSITKTISDGTSKAFNLETETYYVLLARAAVTDGSITYHKTNRAISAGRNNMTVITQSGSAGANILVKVHGAMMTVAWLLLSNLGMTIAINYKPMWASTRPGGVDFWFTLHRLIMIGVLLFTTTAFIIIFVRVQEFSSGSASHAGIGIAVMCLAIFNPVLAIFRPHPYTPRRTYFNVIHRIVAYSARGLSSTNLFLGITAIGTMPSWSIGVMGGAVGFYALMELVLGIASWRYGHTVWTGGSKSNSEIDPDPKASDLQIATPEHDREIKGQGMKNVLLIVYFLGLLAFSITIFVAISQA